MADKLEVIPGPGIVARFGEVAVWAGPQASPALQAHLVAEAQKVCHTPNAADQLASSFIAVLQRGDPEPQAPFAIAGPGSAGLTLFLHGPVQAWDSGRWLAPQPVPGWMVSPIGRPWPLIILPYGAQPPPPSQQGNPFDLAQGAVPGAGFVLLRPVGGPPAPGGQPTVTAQAPVVPSFGVASSGAGGPGAGGPGAGGPGAGGPSAQAPFAQSSAVQPSYIGQSPYGQTAQAPQQAPSFQPQPAAQERASGTVDLRSATSPYRASLLLASDWRGPTGPSVPGVNCEVGHFNNPRATSCARCGRPIAPGAPKLNGPRPPVGVLLTDDGSLWSLDKGCLIGSAPSTAVEVQSGALQPLALRSGDNHVMAPAHAEVQVREWDVYLIERGGESGTWAQVPGAQSWDQLGRGEQRLLPSGSHISCGGRVLTFLSGWPT